MEKKKRIGAIFDLTGVVFKNGREYVEKTFREVFKTYNIDLPQSAFDEKYRGQSLQNMMAAWRQDFGIKIEISPKEFSKKAAKIEFKLLEENLKNEIDNDLINLLKELKKNYVKLAIVTSSTKKRAFKLLEMLKVKKYFDKIITVEDVKNREPKPDAHLLGASFLDLKPSNCIVIEDSFHGIQAAKEAKMKTIGFVIYSKEQEKKLKEAKVDLIIKNFKELNYKIIYDL